MSQESKNIERVDIKSGFLCNNRCFFCVQGNKREIYGNKTTDEVKKLLDEAIKDSDSIVFTGGEPTIRKDIVELT
jgi:molybdenum cofactor biosynthesis enzyme MoaA